MTSKLKTAVPRLAELLTAAAVALAAAAGCHHIPTSRSDWGVGVGEYTVEDEQMLHQWHHAVTGSDAKADARNEEAQRQSRFSFFKGLFNSGGQARPEGAAGRGKNADEELPGDSNLFPADRYDTPKMVGRIVPIKKRGASPTGSGEQTARNEELPEDTSDGQYAVAHSGEEGLARSGEASGADSDGQLAKSEISPIPESPQEYLSSTREEEKTGTGDDAASENSVAVLDTPPLPPQIETLGQTEHTGKPIATIWGNNPSIQSVTYYDRTLADPSPSSLVLQGSAQEQWKKADLPRPDMERGFETSLEHLPGSRCAGARTEAVSPNLDGLLPSKTTVTLAAGSAASAEEQPSEPARLHEPVPVPAAPVPAPVAAASNAPPAEPVASIALTDLGQDQVSGSIAFADNSAGALFTNSARELSDDARPISHEQIAGQQENVSPIAMDTARGMIDASPLGGLSHSAPMAAAPTDEQTAAALPAAPGSWRDDVHRAVDRLREEISRQADEGTLRPMEAARLRLLMLAVGDSPNSAGKIASTNPVLQSFWEKQLSGLRILLDSPGEGPTLSLAERDLNASLAWLKTACPPRIEKALLAEECSSFGLYTPKKGTYSPGEEAHVYMELGNISSYPIDQEYEVAVVCRWELYDAQGQPALPPSQQICASRSSSPLKDIVLNVPVTLPKVAAAGDYRLKVSVRDHHSQSTELAETDLVLPVR
ncbi:MAG: hypothetical protein IJH68_03250 [Thermoguttaceae bacterium]|nr:hypothetical protein [Thermoguttaceae bacterium]